MVKNHLQQPAAYCIIPKKHKPHSGKE